MKKALKILAAAFFAVTSLSFIGCKGTARYESYADAKLYQTGGASFTQAQVREVEIDWMGGGVEITQSVDGEVRVSEETELADDAERMHYYLSGTTLKIRYCASGLRVRQTEKNLQVSIPAGTSLELDCASARVSALDSLELSSLSFESASGGFEAERIRCTGEADVETTSGNIEILELTADELSVETASGSVAIEKLSVRELEADTASGEIFFGLQAACTGEIDTASGRVELKLLDGLGSDILFRSATGQFRTKKEYGKAGSRYTFSPEQGKGSCQLNVETFSGDLAVE